MLTRTWIDTNLSHEQRAALVDWLLERSANPTSALILEGLGELFPQLEAPSVNSVNTWRAKSLPAEMHRRRLHQTAQAAEVLADAGRGSIDEANRVMLQATLFDQLTALREGRADEVNLDGLGDLVLAVSRLAKSSQAERALVAKLEQMERERDQAKAIAGDVDLTPEERAAKIRAHFGLG